MRFLFNLICISFSALAFCSLFKEIPMHHYDHGWKGQCVHYFNGGKIVGRPNYVMKEMIKAKLSFYAPEKIDDLVDSNNGRIYEMRVLHTTNKEKKITILQHIAKKSNYEFSGQTQKIRIHSNNQNQILIGFVDQEEHNFQDILKKYYISFIAKSYNNFYTVLHQAKTKKTPVAGKHVMTLYDAYANEHFLANLDRYRLLRILYTCPKKRTFIGIAQRKLDGKYVYFYLYLTTPITKIFEFYHK